ncbi:hypothetical protein ACTXT7_002163 [Hymenolepis weldensis]
MGAARLANLLELVSFGYRFSSAQRRGENGFHPIAFKAKLRQNGTLSIIPSYEDVLGEEAPTAFGALELSIVQYLKSFVSIAIPNIC